MNDRIHLTQLLEAAQCLAKQNGDVVLSYLINMALLHAEQLDNDEEMETIAELA
ncbi:hypothetical protein GA0004734_00000580 [Rhizobium sp. 9140]|nr:hypothetical protein GA0004734_00000580 [Rhizobium sp. 9140]